MKNQYQNKLAHLTDEEIEILIERYYNGDKNSILLKEYNIDIQSSFLLKTFPMKTHNNELCPFCNIPMFSHRKSKSSVSKEIIFCQECKHTLNDTYCKCEACIDRKNKEQEIREQEREIIDNINKNILMEEYLYDKNMPIDIEELDIRDKLYISALLRTALSEDLTDIKSLSSVLLTLAPTEEFRGKIISYLRSRKIIIFSPNTPVDSLVFNNDEIEQCRLFDTVFRLNVSQDEDDIKIENLLHLNVEENIDEELKLELWLEIGLYECVEFLYARMEEYNLPKNHIGEKTISSIKEALKEFSISQVYNFIWGASINASDFYKNSHVSKKHAVNTIAGTILRRSEKAIAENRETKKFGRDWNYPQTIISEVFFNNILKIGDEGFDSVINLKI